MICSYDLDDYAKAAGMLDGWCFAHHPDREAERRASREKGGRGKATRARLDRLVPATLKPTISKLLDALDEVHAGTLDPRQANAMAALAGAIVRVYQVGTLEERIAALEAAQQGQNGGRWA